MIPEAYITEWSNIVRWRTNEQVEQDLILCRALVEMFSDPFLYRRLAFRGGTAIHKLFLHPQARYSEDIDLVQMRSEPIKETIVHLQERLAFLGKGSVKQKDFNTTVVFRFNSESAPFQKLRLKIETNCREHFAVQGFIDHIFTVSARYFSGTCTLKTFRIEELLGSKLRALYQRTKGRDLFDLYKAMTTTTSLPENILHCYNAYMAFAVGKPPSRREFQKNLDLKMSSPEFLGDTMGLLRPDERYVPTDAYELISRELLERL
jgi:predicted nucleotidyltransferase component of viral defense system